MSTTFKEVKFEQPESFEFNSKNQEKVRKILAKYPDGKQMSAVMPLLDLAQRQHYNWLPRAAMDHIAFILEMPPMKVYEVATFYSMYYKQPVGKNLIQICRTTPCWLKGSDEITETCKQKLGIVIGESTTDNKFTLIEVECLGACVNAPMVQINDDYFEDLTPQTMSKILDDLIDSKPIKRGPQSGRKSSEPQTNNKKNSIKNKD